jgi:sodium-dependent dicarboxylate transporter 2/3/5
MKLIGLWTGPMLFAASVISPPLEGVTEVGMRTLGIFLWTAAWWFTEAIPIPATSLFSLAMLVLCGVLSVQAAFSTWSNWIVIFLLGAFIIGHAVTLHGLARRIAYYMAGSSLVAGNPWRLLMVFGVGAAVMSPVLSNVITTLVFLSIAIGLVKSLDLQQGTRYPEVLFLSIAWGATMGGIATPIGAPTNLIAIGVANSLEYRIGFLQWMMICVPMTVVGLMAMFLVIRYVLRPETPERWLSPSFLREELTKLGPWNRGEQLSAIVFSSAMGLWLLPDVLPLFLSGGRQHPWSAWVTTHLDWSVTALVMATSLFVLPVDWENRKFVMSWEEAVKGVEWGTLALIAAALALGNALANSTLGLGQFLEQGISDFSASAGSQLIFVFGVVTFTTVMTSFVSNIAAVSMVGALVQGMGDSAGINPIALLVAVGVAASMAFPLPVGTPYNAMVFASGYVRMGTMVKGGSAITVLVIPVVSLLVFYLASLLLPWPL